MDEISELTAQIVDLEDERDKLKAEVERLKDDKDLLNGQLKQSRKHVSDVDLQNRALKEALDMFLIGFRSRQDKLGRRWSLGYWEGTDPGMEMVLGGNAESIKNTRFNAVIAYTEEEIQRALKAECADSRIESSDAEKPAGVFVLCRGCGERLPSPSDAVHSCHK